MHLAATSAISPSLWGLAYCSLPTTPFSDRDLSDLMQAARRANAHYGVTGRLYVLESGHGEPPSVARFLQWIEGTEDAVGAVYARIAADTRHRNLQVLYHGPVRARRFPEWDMAIEVVDELTFLVVTDELAAAA